MTERQSLCIRCQHLSIWYAETEGRICERTYIPVHTVLQGLVDDCPNFQPSRHLRGFVAKQESFVEQVERISKTRVLKRRKHFNDTKKGTPKKWIPPEDRK